MKKLVLILVLSILMLIISTNVFGETQEQEFTVNMDSFEMIDQSNPGMGTDWETMAQVYNSEGKLITLDKNKPVKITELKVIITLLEKDEVYPDKYKKTFALGEGANEFDIQTYERKKHGICEKMWAKWKICFTVEKVVVETSPEVSSSPKISSSPDVIETSPEKSSIPATTAKVLPKTGEEKKNYTIPVVIGCVLICIGVVVFIISRKVKNIE